MPPSAPTGASHALSHLATSHAATTGSGRWQRSGRLHDRLPSLPSRLAAQVSMILPFLPSGAHAILINYMLSTRARSEATGTERYGPLDETACAS